MVSSHPGTADIPARRFASIAGGIAAFALATAWLALTWDAWLTNFQVRWMCDEDRPFVMLRRGGVESLAIPEEILGHDDRALAAFAPAYPVVAAAASTEGRRAAYALTERWPKRVRSYWGYAVQRTELSVIERASPINRVLATTSLYRRIERESAPFAGLRARVSPPPEVCTASDRVEFVKRVLSPPG